MAHIMINKKRVNEVWMIPNDFTDFIPKLMGLGFEGSELNYNKNIDSVNINIKLERYHIGYVATIYTTDLYNTSIKKCERTSDILKHIGLELRKARIKKFLKDNNE